MASPATPPHPIDGLKHRNIAKISHVSDLVDEHDEALEDAEKPKEEIIWGKTPDGTGNFSCPLYPASPHLGLRSLA